MKVDTDKLKTVANYADLIEKDRGWIYKLIRKGKIKPVIIDGVSFVDTESPENPKVL